MGNGSASSTKGDEPMRRFFIEKGAISDADAVISGELFHHIARVLRMQPGDRLILMDEEGWEHQGLIKEIGSDKLIVGLEGSTLRKTGEHPRITLCQGLPKGDKLELIIQKCTELGLDRLIPFTSGRTVPKLDQEREQKRLERWRRIAREASQQAGRPTVPEIASVTPLDRMLDTVDAEVKLLLWEGEQTRRLKEVMAALPKPRQVAVIVGPEGGLSREEAELAERRGFVPVTLGDRILRTETAGIAITAILQYQWGDVG